MAFPHQHSFSGLNYHSAPEDKIACFRSLFRGRTDVFPQRFESVFALVGQVTRLLVAMNGCEVFARSRASNAPIVFTKIGFQLMND